MELIQTAIDLFLHLDRHLADLTQALGPWIYFLLFAIVFCETGLVVTPFLPGDSLLFAIGALASIPDSGLSLGIIAALLIAAAILGDAVNYAVGAYVGPRVFASEQSRWLNKKHLMRTHEFYEKYGGKTIILARFVPIVRTFAPFVAGVGSMTYARFALYNVTGAIAWVLSFLLAGYFFGQLPVVKEYFHLVIVAIIVISVLPMVFEFVRARREARVA
ncbi:MAG: DedA family protein [Proteobacteria bacterium]|nr:MAG: DedA family protein [Pseudomonadota bacterium]